MRSTLVKERFAAGLRVREEDFLKSDSPLNLGLGGLVGQMIHTNYGLAEFS